MKTDKFIAKSYKRKCGRKILKLPVIRKVITIPKMKFFSTIFLLLLLVFFCLIGKINLLSALLLAFYQILKHLTLISWLCLCPPYVCLFLCFMCSETGFLEMCSIRYTDGGGECHTSADHVTSDTSRALMRFSCVSSETVRQRCKQGDPLPPVDSLFFNLFFFSHHTH